MTIHPDTEARNQFLDTMHKSCNKKCKNKLSVKLLTPTAKMPSKANPTDAGLDLYADESGSIYRGERKLISTGISVAIPEGYVGLIWPRSGLSVKNGISVMAGVIDAGYRGEIKVCLLNTNQNTDFFKFERGDKIAQILIQPVLNVELEEVDDLPSSDRNNKGFGSSGR